MAHYIIKKHIATFLVLSICMLFSCERNLNITQEIRFINKTNETIYIVSLNSSKILLQPSLGIGTEEYPLIKLKPEEYYLSEIMVGPDYDRDNHYKLQQYLIYLEKTIDTYSLEDIMKSEYFDARLVYSFDELKKNKYTIRYIEN